MVWGWPGSGIGSLPQLGRVFENLGEVEGFGSEAGLVTAVSVEAGSLVSSRVCLQNILACYCGGLLKWSSAKSAISWAVAGF